ncbi:Phenylacetic acid catabolic protein [Effusibacillus pohliae]|uniref:Phenylacetic acid catabolic protein n=1 Tax=Effusibacillus pohliae TaxID=232270 RepID=UPI00035FB515|nr:Phenylacetic acid catabolic protein [Effusibacillus pohliae]
MAEKSAGIDTFIEIIETIADNKFVLGDKLVHIGVSGPNLEATLAAIAMAQGELGHARVLYYWVYDLRGTGGKKPDITAQTGKAFKSVVQIHDWITLIAGLYTVNTALDLVLRSMLAANRSDVAARIHKLIREQREHIIYSRGWAEQLLQDRGAIPRKFREALDAAALEVEAWLSAIENRQVLTEEGYMVKDAALLKRFRDEMAKSLAREEIAHAH